MENDVYSYYKEKLGVKGFVLKDGVIHYLENCKYHAESMKRYFEDHHAQLERDYVSFQNEVIRNKTKFISYLSPREIRAIYLTFLSEITFLNTSSKRDISGIMFVPEDRSSLSLSQQKLLDEKLEMLGEERWIQIFVIPSYLDRTQKEMRSIPIIEYRKDDIDGQANPDQVWGTDNQKAKQKTIH